MHPSGVTSRFVELDVCEHRVTGRVPGYEFAFNCASVDKVSEKADDVRNLRVHTLTVRCRLQAPLLASAADSGWLCLPHFLFSTRACKSQTPSLPRRLHRYNTTKAGYGGTMIGRDTPAVRRKHSISAPSFPRCSAPHTVLFFKFIPVFTPLPYVASHVVQPKLVRWKAPHGASSRIPVVVAFNDWLCVSQTLKRTWVLATETNFIPRLLTHGRSFIASSKVLLVTSRWRGVPLVAALGRATACEEALGAVVSVAITVWLGLAETGAG